MTDSVAKAGDTVAVKVSAAMCRLPFHGCEPDYIRDVCKAACCRSSTAKTGMVVTIHPTEAERIKARGGVIIANLLQPKQGERQCPFMDKANLCSLHFTPDKPFGCIASPFTLTKQGDTLIVRNRYKLLRCYKAGKQIPAYRAFRASLDLIFGADEAARICGHFDAGGGDIVARMPRRSYDMLKENDLSKKLA